MNVASHHRLGFSQTWPLLFPAVEAPAGEASHLLGREIIRLHCIRWLNVVLADMTHESGKARSVVADVCSAGGSSNCSVSTTTEDSRVVSEVSFVEWILLHSSLLFPECQWNQSLHCHFFSWSRIGKQHKWTYTQSVIVCMFLGVCFFMLFCFLFKCPVNHVDFTKVKQQYGSLSDSHMGQQRNLILQSTLNIEFTTSISHS